MTLRIIRPGVQTTLQASPRHGLRHLGIPASGAADPLSMALANRLVGNRADVCALEIPFGLLQVACEAPCFVAFTGAPARIETGDRQLPMHRTLKLRAGEQLSVGAPATGARIYMAVAGGILGDEFLGSTSTCLPAGFGGHAGRALKTGDRLEVAPVQRVPEFSETPPSMRPSFTHSFALRCVYGPDAGLVASWSPDQEFETTRRADRTGIEIAGAWPKLTEGGSKPSAPVFPGAVQLTPSGKAFILLPDSQTTGGYPHVLQVIEADRHLLGQIRPGDRIRFLRRTPDQAALDLWHKTNWFRGWLPDLRL